MPINTEKSHRVQVTLSKTEYERLKEETQALRKSGRKATASKYVADALRYYWSLNDFENLMQVLHKDQRARS